MPFVTLEAARQQAPGRLVETASGRLHVRTSGDGPDLLLIHGVTDNGGTWDRVAPALVGKARLHAIDLPGHGLSDIPARPQTVVEMARAMSDYLDAAKIGRCVVAGNSLGGGVTLALAAREPERVRAALPLGSIGVPFSLPFSLRLLRFFPTAELMRLASALPTLAKPYMRWAFYHRDYGMPRADLDAYWSGWHVRERPRYIRALMRQLDVAEPRPLLAEIRVPVHVIHGVNDRVVPPRVGRELCAAIAGARLTMLERTGHNPQNERPELTAALIAETLAAPPPG
jgi:pimeloyl-ACP methyl ester carboxylesterase